MTATKIKETLIENIIFLGSQSLNLREIYKLNDRKIKLEIKSDAYDMQSYARAYILKDEKWEQIYSIPYSQMKTSKGSCYGVVYKNSPEKAQREFILDVTRMKKCVEEILF
jgi:hypothetical protein